MGVADGAVKGAAMGSVVPGIGTVAGGVVGGIAGLFGGDDDEEGGGPAIGPGSLAAPIPPPDGPSWDAVKWGGRGNDNLNGAAVGGTGGADLDVARYREMGENAMGRGGVALNYQDANKSLGRGTTSLGQAGGSLTHATSALNYGYRDRVNAADARNSQQSALQLQASAAQGEQPSRAELLGRGMIDQSLKAQMAGAAGARGGPLAQMAAQRNAQQGAASFQQNGMNQLSALRADEMERARGAYQAGATGLRNTDYAGAQQATGMANAYTGIGAQRTAIGAQQAGIGATQAQMAQSQGQLEATQRQLNQQGQQYYEGKGFDVRDAQMKAGLAERGLGQERQGMRDLEASKERDQDMALAAAGIGAVGAIGGAAVKSDMRAKNMVPMPLMLQGRKPKAAAPNWLEQYMDRDSVDEHGERHQEEHESRMGQGQKDNAPDWLSAAQGPDLPGGREDPYSGGTPGGIQREDPYGSGEVYYSDANAKRAAFQEGVLYGESRGAAKPDPLPEYARGAPADRPRPESQWKDSTPEQLREAGMSSRVMNNMSYGASRGAAPGGQRAPNAPAGSQAPRMLEVERKTGATGIDPKAHGERPEMAPVQRGNNIGDRPMERGREAPLPAPPASAAHGKPNPLLSLRQDANRRLTGSAWTYKDEHRPPDEQPGQPHYGGMAQEYEKNPITATAVRRGPDGMRMVDTASMVQVQGDGIASLQEQIDELRGRRG